MFQTTSATMVTADTTNEPTSQPAASQEQPVMLSTACAEEGIRTEHARYANKRGLLSLIRCETGFRPTYLVLRSELRRYVATRRGAAQK